MFNVLTRMQLTSLKQQISRAETEGTGAFNHTIKVRDRLMFCLRLTIHRHGKWMDPGVIDPALLEEDKTLAGKLEGTP